MNIIPLIYQYNSFNVSDIWTYVNWILSVGIVFFHLKPFATQVRQRDYKYLDYNVQPIIVEFSLIKVHSTIIKDVVHKFNKAIMICLQLVQWNPQFTNKFLPILDDN